MTKEGCSPPQQHPAPSLDLRLHAGNNSKLGRMRHALGRASTDFDRSRARSGHGRHHSQPSRRQRKSGRSAHPTWSTSPFGREHPPQAWSKPTRVWQKPTQTWSECNPIVARAQPESSRPDSAEAAPKLFETEHISMDRLRRGALDDVYEASRKTGRSNAAVSAGPRPTMANFGHMLVMARACSKAPGRYKHGGSASAISLSSHFATQAPWGAPAPTRGRTNMPHIRWNASDGDRMLCWGCRCG